MKKIIFMVCGILIFVAVAVSGTIAYFTDADQATNVFTVGKVVIQLIEQQRNGSSLVNFVNNKKLMPMFAPSDFDSMGLPTAQEFQDKIVQVKNIGKSDAYIRVYVGVPAELDDKGALHLLDGNRFNTATGNSYAFSTPTKIENQTVGTETFNFYCYTLNSALKVGDTTGAAISGVYLDEKVDFNTSDNKYYIGSKKVSTNQLATNFNNPVNIPVYVQAVQTEGFATPSQALSAAFTEAPWGGSLPSGGGSGEPTPPPQGPVVDTSEENLNKAENKPQFNAETQKYEISNATQLYSFAMMVNDGTDFKGQTVKLMDDIYLNSAQGWNPIGDKSSRSFSGVFDGGGKTIYNMNINSKSADTYSVGLFGRCKGTVKDLNIANAKIEYTANATVYNGFIAGAIVNTGQINNCHVIGSDIDVKTIEDNNAMSKVGGIVGIIDAPSSEVKVTGCSVSNCKLTGTAASSVEANVAGIAAGVNLINSYRDGKLIVDSCIVSGCTIKAIGSANTKVGGIISTVGLSNMHIELGLFNVTNCHVKDYCKIYGIEQRFIGTIVVVVENINGSQHWSCDNTNTVAGDTKAYYKNGTNYTEIANCPKCNP